VYKTNVFLKTIAHAYLYPYIIKQCSWCLIFTFARLRAIGVCLMKLLKLCCFCPCILNFILVTTLSPMENKASFPGAIREFTDFVENEIVNSGPYKSLGKIDTSKYENAEFVKFLVEDKKFYKNFSEKIKNWVHKFETHGDLDINLYLHKKDKEEIRKIMDKVRVRYTRWENMLEEERVKSERKKEEERASLEQEKKRLESEFEKANIVFSESRDKFESAKKKYGQIRQEQKNKQIELEFEKANIEFADANKKFGDAKKRYEQGLKDVENKNK
jgi:hypothetical protein